MSIHSNVTLHVSNNVNNICKIKKTKYKKAGSTAIIYKTYDNKIIKVIPLKSNKEYNIVKKIYEKLKKSNINVLFVNILQIKKCGEYNYYLLDKYIDDINGSFLLKINKHYQKNLLFQVLFAILYMNHEIKVFHNDLYYKTHIRNVMYTTIDNPLKLNLYGIDIKCEKYLCKIIDFGWAQNIPGFRTTEYHKKYFNKNKIISEIVIFSYFYLLELKPNDIEYSKYVLLLLQKMSNMVEKLLKNNNNLNSRNFDVTYFNLLHSFYENI